MQKTYLIDTGECLEYSINCLLYNLSFWDHDITLVIKTIPIVYIFHCYKRIPLTL